MLPRRIALSIVAALLAAASSHVAAEVDKESIFPAARRPASELDLTLSSMQRSWWQKYVSAPDADTRKAHPLVTQAAMGVNLQYLGDDRISATGWITNLDGFLTLSPEQRKQLISDTLDLVKSHLFLEGFLVDKKSGRRTKDKLERKHILLSVVINSVTENDKSQSIRLFLPSDLGVGQAGYKDGQFVFSEPYYLNLKVHNGFAVSGDPNRFIVEHE
jgi:hypothetical protein